MLVKVSVEFGSNLSNPLCLEYTVQNRKIITSRITDPQELGPYPVFLVLFPQGPEQI